MCQADGTTSHKHILIVDDDMYIRALVENSLTLMNPNYKISTASNGSTALEQFKEEPVDLILTDNQMPKMSGLELSQAVRKISASAAIILMTGNGNDSVRQQVKDLNLQGYMEKPFSLIELQTAVKGLLCPSS
ncbi:MAG: response regulator [Chloroflexota bacterium]